MSFIKRMLCGLLIGTASVTPGVSGGVLAVAMGLYEPMIRALGELTKSFKKNIRFLLPIGLGAGVGLIVFSYVMKWLFNVAPNEVMFLFFGLVAGSLPSVVKEANEKGFRPYYLIATVLGIAIVSAAAFFDVNSGGIAASATWSFARGLLCGAVLAVGTIVPGISTSFILMYLGNYDELLTAITEFNIIKLLPVGLGFLLLAYPLVKAVGFLFRKYHGASYYAVLGFLLGSMIIIFPGFQSGWRIALDMLIFVFGTAVSVIFMNRKTKSGNNPDVHPTIDAEGGEEAP